jgi:hypothetical protein
MVCAANDDWSAYGIVVVPQTECRDNYRPTIQGEAQDRIGAALQAMYADLLLQPLSPKLAQLVQQLRNRHETSHAS